MLQIPLDHHRNKGFEVDVDDERGSVLLTLDLELGEVVGPIREHPEPLFICVDDEPMPDVVDELTLLRWQVRRLDSLVEYQRERLEARCQEVAYLHDRLVDARCEHEISRQLLPDEARAVAAALVHYAGEIEAFGRRP